MRVKAQTRVDSARMARITAATEELPRQAVMLRGRVLVGVMRTISSPHFRARMVETLKKNSRGITNLKKRIARDIAGVDDASKIKPFGAPLVRKNGVVLAGSLATGKPLTPREFRGNFGFVVVASARGRKGKGSVSTVSPESVSESRIFGSPRGMRKRAARKPRGIHYVTAPALRAFVKKQQKHAGQYLSGWAPAARFFFAPRGISAGYFAEHGRPGSARLARSRGKAAASVTNSAAYSSGQASRHQAQFRGHGLRMAASALAKVEREIRAWYRKKTRRTS